jgi:hypothetical protein
MMISASYATREIRASTMLDTRCSAPSYCVSTAGSRHTGGTDWSAGQARLDAAAAAEHERLFPESRQIRLTTDLGME